MALEVKSDHEKLREREKMVPEAEPETKKQGGESLRLWEPFYVTLNLCLLQLILKFNFAERQF